MCRLAYFGTFGLVMSMLLGCAMCCGPFDDDYGQFGGRFHRVDRKHGRVGSILSDPAYMGGGAGADSNLTNRAAGETDFPEDDFEGMTEEELREQLDRTRQELDLEGNGNELPNSSNPQPYVGDDRETSRGWQNRLRGRSRQWR